MKKYEQPAGSLPTKKKVKLTETDEGYEGNSKDRTYFHFTPTTTFLRTREGRWLNSNQHQNKVDSVLKANPEIVNPYPQKKISRKANGGSFIPFPKAGQK